MILKPWVLGTVRQFVHDRKDTNNSISLSQITTSLMISRLQLNLRRGNAGITSLYEDRDTGPTVVANYPRYSNNEALPQRIHSSSSSVPGSTTFFSVGNLGEELEGSFLTLEKDKFEAEKEFSRSYELRAIGP